MKHASCAWSSSPRVPWPGEARVWLCVAVVGAVCALVCAAAVGTMRAFACVAVGLARAGVLV